MTLMTLADNHIARRILVVDDYLPTRRTIGIGLKVEGYAVDVAASTDEALNKLEQDVYDYVLSDISMPQKGGLDLMVEGQFLCPTARWILMSAYDFPAEEVRRRNLTPHGFLKKPFRIADLIKLLVDTGHKVV